MLCLSGGQSERKADDLTEAGISVRLVAHHCGSGGTGRRAGLRIPWLKSRGGSNPSFRIHKSPMFMRVLEGSDCRVTWMSPMVVLDMSRVSIQPIAKNHFERNLTQSV